MALKKGFFKGLQGGVNHSPLRMHDGTKNTGPGHSKKTVNIQQQVNNDQLQFDGQNSIDPKSSQYRQMYNQGDIFNPSLDEVVIDSRVDYDKFPYYDDLTKQEKEIFHNDQSPIGDAVRRRGYTKKGLAEDTTKMVTDMLVKQPLSALQVPQSLLVEGVEALRGNDYNFANAITNDTQRLPSETIGFEDKPGWDVGGSLNTIMDVVADPSNLTGVGLGAKGLKTLNKVKNIPKSLTNFANNIGNNSESALSAFRKRPDFEAQKLINTQKGTDNVVYDLDNVSQGSGFDFDFSNLPQRANSSNSLENFINRRLLGSDNALGNQLEPFARELSKGASTFREARDFAAKNMESPQGQQRLNDLVESEINRKTRIPASLSNFKDYEIPANMSAKNKQKYVDHFAKKHKDKLIKTESINERLANEAFDADGNYNPRKAVDIIYSAQPTKRGYQNLNESDNFFKNNAFMLDSSGLKETTSKPKFALGTNYTESGPTAYHELLGHGGQNINGLGAIDADRRLLSLSQIPDAGGGQNYFNIGNSDKYRSMYSNSTATSNEPYAFAQELKKAMYDKGILKNNNGTWETVTPEMLKKAKTVFDKTPAGTVVPGSHFASDTRALNFIEDLDGLSTEMNKLIGANNPGDADGKNKFDLLKANSMEANA